MGLFDNFKSDVIEEKARDYTGGFKVFEADIYEATIKLAFRNQSKDGALAVVFEFQLPNGDSYKEDIYFTNKEGKHTYMTKNDKVAGMPGFITLNNICLIASGKDLSKQDTETKVVKVYDAKEKKELACERPVLVDLLGKKVALGIQKRLENKQEKDSNGKYVTVAATREVNKIHTVFHPEHKVTVNEAESRTAAKRDGVPVSEPKAWEAWLKSNKGQVYDAREIKDGSSKSSSGGSAPSKDQKDDLFS